MNKKQKVFQAPDNSRAASLTGLPLASFTRRAIALFIDFVVSGIMFAFLVLGVMLIGKWTGLFTFPDIDVDFRFFGNWYSVVWLVLYFTLSMYLSNGRTVGKRLCRIRILSLVHDHIGLWHSFERAIGYGASALEFGFGFFQYFIRPDRRTVHDRIAETIVISDPKKKKKQKNKKKGEEEEF